MESDGPNQYKKMILESRELSTMNLVSAIRNTQSKVKVFISSSGVGYYGSKGDKVLTEESEAGDDFLAQVCKVWETETERANESWYQNRNASTGNCS